MKKPLLLKITAVLTAFFIASDPGNGYASTPRFDSAPALKIPVEFGREEESFTGRSQKTILYIQDAHDSLEAQKNIAALVSHFTENSGIKTVFEEGYEGPVPTDQFFGFIKDIEARLKVSSFLLDKLRIGGAEYAHINRKTDFNLIGADHLEHYLQNIQAFRDASRKNADIEKDLTAILTEIESLAHQKFPKPLREWLDTRDRYEAGQLDLLAYVERGWKILESQPGGASKTALPLISMLLTARNSPDEALAAEARAIAPQELFKEITALDSAVAALFIREENERQLLHYRSALHLLKRLNQIEVTPAEYTASKEILSGLNTRELADFIARESRKSLVLSKSWEENIKTASRFYELAHQRDDAIEQTLKTYLSSTSENTAVLVYGGFHKAGILSILRRLGVSYRVITPNISGADPVHENYYKQLMAEGAHDYEKTLLLSTRIAPKATRPPSAFVEPFGETAVQTIYTAVAANPGTPISLLEQKLPFQTRVRSVTQTSKFQNVRSEMRMVTSYDLAEAFGDLGRGPKLTGGRNDTFLYENGEKIAVIMPWSKFIFRALDQDGNEIPNRIFKITHFADQNSILFDDAKKMFQMQSDPPLQGVPKLIRSGMTKDGGIWLEIEGIPSARAMTREIFGRAPRLFEVLIRAAEILNSIHDRGIIHGDVKPDNLLINTAGELEWIDFGGNYTEGFVALDENLNPVTEDLAPDVDVYSFILLSAQLLDHQISSQPPETAAALREIRDDLLRLVLKSWSFERLEQTFLFGSWKTMVTPRPRKEWPKSLAPIIEKLKNELPRVRQLPTRSELRAGDEALREWLKKTPPLFTRPGVGSVIALPSGGAAAFSQDAQQNWAAIQAAAKELAAVHRSAFRGYQPEENDPEQWVKYLTSPALRVLVQINEEGTIEGHLLSENRDASPRSVFLKEVAVIDEVQLKKKGSLLLDTFLMTVHKESSSQEISWLSNFGVIALYKRYLERRNIPYEFDDWTKFTVPVSGLAEFSDQLKTGRSELRLGDEDAEIPLGESRKVTLGTGEKIIISGFNPRKNTSALIEVRSVEKSPPREIGAKVKAPRREAEIRVSAPPDVVILRDSEWLEFLTEHENLPNQVDRFGHWNFKSLWTLHDGLLARAFGRRFMSWRANLPEERKIHLFDLVTKARIEVEVIYADIHQKQAELSLRPVVTAGTDILFSVQALSTASRSPRQSVRSELRASDNADDLELLAAYPQLKQISDAWEEFLASSEADRNRFLNAYEGGAFVRSPFQWMNFMKENWGLNAQSRILDVGSGNGLAAMAFNILTGAKVTSIEIDPMRWVVLQNFLRFLKEQKGLEFPGVRFEQADFLSYPLENTDFIYFYYTHSVKNKTLQGDWIVNRLSEKLPQNAVFVSPGFYLSSEYSRMLLVKMDRESYFAETELDYREVFLPKGISLVHTSEAVVLTRRNEDSPPQKDARSELRASYSDEPAVSDLNLAGKLLAADLFIASPAFTKLLTFKEFFFQTIPQGTRLATITKLLNGQQAFSPRIQNHFRSRAPAERAFFIQGPPKNPASEHSEYEISKTLAGLLMNMLEEPERRQFSDFYKQNFSQDEKFKKIIRAMGSFRGIVISEGITESPLLPTIVRHEQFHMELNRLFQAPAAPPELSGDLRAVQGMLAEFLNSGGLDVLRSSLGKIGAYANGVELLSRGDFSFLEEFLAQTIYPSEHPEELAEAFERLKNKIVRTESESAGFQAGMKVLRRLQKQSELAAAKKIELIETLKIQPRDKDQTREPDSSPASDPRALFSSESLQDLYVKAPDAFIQNLTGRIQNHFTRFGLQGGALSIGNQIIIQMMDGASIRSTALEIQLPVDFDLLSQKTNEFFTSRSELRTARAPAGLTGFDSQTPIWDFLTAFGIDPAKAEVETLEGPWGRVKAAEHAVFSVPAGQELKNAVMESAFAVFDSRDIQTNLAKNAISNNEALDFFYLLTHQNKPAAFVWAIPGGPFSPIFYYPLSQQPLWDKQTAAQPEKASAAESERDLEIFIRAFHKKDYGKNPATQGGLPYNISRGHGMPGGQLRTFDEGLAFPTVFSLNHATSKGLLETFSLLESAGILSVKGKSVSEIGSGAGWIGTQIALRGADHVHLYDLSLMKAANALATAKRYGTDNRVSASRSNSASILPPSDLYLWNIPDMADSAPDVSGDMPLHQVDAIEANNRIRADNVRKVFSEVLAKARADALFLVRIHPWDEPEFFGILKNSGWALHPEAERILQNPAKGGSYYLLLPEISAAAASRRMAEKDKLPQSLKDNPKLVSVFEEVADELQPSGNLMPIILIEGMPGSGKSSRAKDLKAVIESQGRKAVIIHSEHYLQQGRYNKPLHGFAGLLSRWLLRRPASELLSYAASIFVNQKTVDSWIEQIRVIQNTGSGSGFLKVNSNPAEDLFISQETVLIIEGTLSTTLFASLPNTKFLFLDLEGSKIRQQFVRRTLRETSRGLIYASFKSWLMGPEIAIRFFRSLSRQYDFTLNLTDESSPILTRQDNIQDRANSKEKPRSELRAEETGPDQLFDPAPPSMDLTDAEKEMIRTSNRNGLLRYGTSDETKPVWLFGEQDVTSPFIKGRLGDTDEPFIKPELYEDKKVLVVPGYGNLPFLLRAFGASAVTAMDLDPATIAWQKLKWKTGLEGMQDWLFVSETSRPMVRAHHRSSWLSYLNAPPEKGTLDRLTFQIGDILNDFPVTAEKYDLVVIPYLFGFAHGLITEDQWDRVLENLSKVLSPEGRILLVPGKMDLSKFKESDEKTQTENYQIWLNDLERKGWKAIHSKRYGFQNILGYEPVSAGYSVLTRLSKLRTSSSQGFGSENMGSRSELRADEEPSQEALPESGADASFARSEAEYSRIIAAIEKLSGSIPVFSEVQEFKSRLENEHPQSNAMQRKAMYHFLRAVSEHNGGAYKDKNPRHLYENDKRSWYDLLNNAMQPVSIALVLIDQLPLKSLEEKDTQTLFKSLLENAQTMIAMGYMRNHFESKLRADEIEKLFDEQKPKSSTSPHPLDKEVPTTFGGPYTLRRIVQQLEVKQGLWMFGPRLYEELGPEDRATVDNALLPETRERLSIFRFIERAWDELQPSSGLDAGIEELHDRKNAASLKALQSDIFSFEKKYSAHGVANGFHAFVQVVFEGKVRSVFHGSLTDHVQFHSDTAGSHGPFYILFKDPLLDPDERSNHIGYLVPEQSDKDAVAALAGKAEKEGVITAEAAADIQSKLISYQDLVDLNRSELRVENLSDYFDAAEEVLASPVLEGGNLALKTFKTLTEGISLYENLLKRFDTLTGSSFSSSLSEELSTLKKQLADSGSQLITQAAFKEGDEAKAIKAINDLRAGIRNYEKLFNDAGIFTKALTHLQADQKLLLSAGTQTLLNDISITRRRIWRAMEHFTLVTDQAAGKPYGIIDPELRLNGLVREVIAAESKRFSLYWRFANVDFKPGTIPVISGDTSRLFNAFSEIIRNAVFATVRRDLHNRYSPAGLVEIKTVLSQDDFIEVTITDTGIGISEEVVKLVEYYAYSRSNFDQDIFFGGRGIGIPTAALTFQEHGGTFKIDSVESQGTLVTVRLPVRLPNRSELRNLKAPEANQETPAVKKATASPVDELKVMRSSMRHFLRRQLKGRNIDPKKYVFITGFLPYRILAARDSEGKILGFAFGKKGNRHLHSLITEEGQEPHGFFHEKDEHGVRITTYVTEDERNFREDEFVLGRFGDVYRLKIEESGGNPVQQSIEYNNWMPNYMITKAQEVEAISRVLGPQLYQGLRKFVPEDAKLVLAPGMEPEARMTYWPSVQGAIRSREEVFGGLDHEGFDVAHIRRRGEAQEQLPEGTPIRSLVNEKGRVQWVFEDNVQSTAIVLSDLVLPIGSTRMIIPKNPDDMGKISITKEGGVTFPDDVEVEIEETPGEKYRVAFVYTHLALSNWVKPGAEVQADDARTIGTIERHRKYPYSPVVPHLHFAVMLFKESEIAKYPDLNYEILNRKLGPDKTILYVNPLSLFEPEKRVELFLEGAQALPGFHSIALQALDRDSLKKLRAKIGHQFPGIPIWTTAGTEEPGPQALQSDLFIRQTKTGWNIEAQTTLKDTLSSIKNTAAEEGSLISLLQRMDLQLRTDPASPRRSELRNDSLPQETEELTLEDVSSTEEDTHLRILSSQLLEIMNGKKMSWLPPGSAEGEKERHARVQSSSHPFSQWRTLPGQNKLPSDLFFHAFPSAEEILQFPDLSRLSPPDTTISENASSFGGVYGSFFRDKNSEPVFLIGIIQTGVNWHRLSRQTKNRYDARRGAHLKPEGYRYSWHGALTASLEESLREIGVRKIAVLSPDGIKEIRALNGIRIQDAAAEKMYGRPGPGYTESEITLKTFDSVHDIRAWVKELKTAPARSELRAAVQSNEAVQKGTLLINAGKLAVMSPAQADELFSRLYLNRNSLRLVIFNERNQLPKTPAFNAIAKLSNVFITEEENFETAAEKYGFPAAAAVLFLTPGEFFQPKLKLLKGVLLKNQAGEIEFARLLAFNGGTLPDVPEENGVFNPPAAFLSDLNQRILSDLVIAYSA